MIRTGKSGVNRAAEFTMRGYEQARANTHSEIVASCPMCGNVLRFETDAIGRALEICDTPLCLLHVPHAARPDTKLPPPENDTPRKPRNYVPKARPDSLSGPDFDARHIA